jgi:glycerol-3-phosphate acyltransferase PlsX
MIRIAIDAMGGDFGPEPILEGVVRALDTTTFLPILVGNREEILSLLPQYYVEQVEVVDANDVIEMADAATDALKRKESSIYKAVELVREGKADAVLSAGHSGATMTTATLRLGRLPGINKPGLATLMPNIEEEKTLVLDVGSVTDCKPINLFQFGVMGEAYAEKIMGISSPKVGLLSNGSEDTKGNELTKATFPLLQGLKGFIGNIEGKDIFNGKVDVVVCDGFTGNILLKTSEGVVSTVFDLMKLYIRKSLPAKIGALMMRKEVFSNMKKQVDKDEYGGAPLLGLKGCAIVSHGASSPKAIMNAVFQAINFVEKDVNSAIEAILVASSKQTGKTEG